MEIVQARNHRFAYVGKIEVKSMLLNVRLVKLTANMARKVINNANRIIEIVAKIINLKIGSIYFIIVFKIKIKILKIETKI
ncbi:MAG: hypothetical protein LBU14_02065 [Candidatus Peribacteria bacterium]|jgi:hypothetical protein|nr:hypothetical protein [Candidatus Peribacteria bacterium]